MPVLRFTFSTLTLALLTALSVQAAEIDQLSPITVTSSTIVDRYESATDDPSSITFIRGTEVEQKHAQNLIEVLRAIPGITADLAGEGDGIKIKIRGVDNQRYMGEKPGVAIVIDGVPVFERTGKVNVDLDNIESIRVVKGGASYLFGEDALAGAVIITTKRGADNAGVTLEADIGSYGYTRTLVKAGIAEADFAGHVQVSDRHNDGYYALSERDAEAVSGNFQYYLDDQSQLSFGFENVDRFRDRDGSVRGVTAAEENPTGEGEGRGYTRMFNVDLQRLNLTYSNDFSDTGNFSAIVYQYEDITDFWSSPIKMDLDGSFVDDDQVDRYANLNYYEQRQRGAKLEARESFGDFALMAGLEIKKNTYDSQTVAKEDYSSRGRVVAAGTVTSDSYLEEITQAFYTEAKLAVDERTTLTANYRFDNIQLDDLDQRTDQRREDEFTIHSWRLGADYDITPQTSLYGSVSTGFRTPTLSEMETNPDLTPETNMNYEIGARTQATLFGWKTLLNSSLFYINRKDFITAALGQYANGNSATDEVLDIYDNIGHTTSKGLELALQTEKKHNWSFDFAYTFMLNKFEDYDNFFLALGNPYARTQVDSEAELVDPMNQVYFKHYDNGGNFVPRSPKHLVNLRAHWYPAANWTVSTEMDYRGESYADEINQETMPARTLVNLGVQYATKAQVLGGAASTVTLFFKVDNLFNKPFYSIVRGTSDSDYDGDYDAEDLSINVDPGRVYTAGFQVKF